MTQAKPVNQKNPIRQRVVLLATNSSQSIIAEVVDGKTNAIAYSAYGEQSAQQEVATRLGFNGQLRESGIGWYMLGNGYRTYNPRLMRFHSPDSWSPFGGGGLNAYMYCVGDPVNRADPTGHLNVFFKRILQIIAFFSGDPQITGSRGYTPEVDRAVRNLGGMYNEPSKDSRVMRNLGVHIVNNSSNLHNEVSTTNTYSPRATPHGPDIHQRRAASSAMASTSKSQKSVRFNHSTKQHDGPQREHNQLQGGEVIPRKDHWPSNETISSNGSSWTNASNTTSASSIHSDRFYHASSLRSLNEALDRLNRMERDRGYSSSESFHSAASSIRNS
jgi:RHS repeat-associated protein